MPAHDIIDNRKEILVDHINRILSSTEAARFAVGYFFLSGLTSIADKLKGVKELRLLIGNTTNRETPEQLAEGYRPLELVKDAAEAQAYPKRAEAKQMAAETAESIRSSMELMDQTDEGECLVKEDATNAFLDGLISVVVDIPIARRAGTMLGELRSKGMTIGIADAIIAATALQVGAPLLANTVEHYPFPNLKVIRGVEV